MGALIRSRLLVLFVAVVLAFAASGCGAIIYPERIDSAHSERLDTAIVVMDCAWLLVGILPGVVALIVDFSTGAVFLSPGETMAPSDEQIVIKTPRRGDDTESGRAEDR